MKNRIKIISTSAFISLSIQMFFLNKAESSVVPQCENIFSKTNLPSAGKNIFIEDIQKNFPEEDIKIHASIEETLYIGKIISFRPFSAEGNKNSLYLLEIKNENSGKTLRALFKPRFYGDGGGWNRPPMEYVSYRIGLLLGLDYIPPVSYRRNVTLGNMMFSEGSIQYFVEGSKGLKNININEWGVKPELFLSNARILDVLLANPDRHIDNFLFGNHWVSNKPQPILIDQAANLKKDAHLRLSTKGPFIESTLVKFDKKTFKLLKELNKEKLNKLNNFLTAGEINRILHHKDGIIHRIQELIEEYGENEVLF